ncbi:demethylmenaquinone methyltransferase/aldolase [Corchorus olitorius]|uniref:Demethylmenaquinone methyltransferase/aldolase n=1 Tax=Corchorus olitorius TaxID=93759 RepID=A0A1R3GRV0_9ROSI|nr:demethylmenaquinone methyltransferase/aldolase [Corchorus olitorius]
MAQKRATRVDGAILKKQKSHDLNELPLKLIEPDVLVTTPPLQIIKPTSEVLASQEAKAYLAGVNSLSYSPNYSPKLMENSEIVQDSPFESDIIFIWQLGTELIPDPSINLAACNVNGSSWGVVLLRPKLRNPFNPKD